MGAGKTLGSLIGAFGGGALGRLLGGSTGGMIGTMAGSMLGGRGLGSFGGMLGGLMGGDKQEAAAIADRMPDEEANILIKAMCNAAKADGQVDQQEIDRILGEVGEVDPAEDAMLRSELSSPLDLQSFVASVPGGMEQQVYAASLFSIKVDTVEESRYLEDLAAALGISQDSVKDVHKAVGLSA